MKYVVLALAVCLICAAAAPAEELGPRVFNGEKAVEGPDAAIETASEAMHLALEAGNLVLDNGKARLVLRKSDAGYRAEFYGIDAEGAWRPVVRDARLGDVIPTAWVYGGCPPPLAYSTAEIARNDARGVTVRLKAALDDHALVTSVSLDTGSSFFHITVEDTITGRIRLEQLISSFAFVPGEQEENKAEGTPAQEADKPDFAWAPRLRGQPGDVIGDESFGSPAAIVQKGKVFAALVPDVALPAGDRTIQAALNLDCSGDVAWLSYGLMKYASREGGFHHHTAGMFEKVSDTTLLYGFYLLVDAQAEPLAGTRAVADFLWETLEKPGPAEQARIQRQDLDAWRWSVWPVVAARMGKRAEVRFTSAEQSLRAAFGLALYAKRTGDEELAAAARGVVDLALGAPATEGAFPVIYRPQAEGNGGQWLPGRRKTEGEEQEDAYSTTDCSNTARWLLKWREFFAKGDEKMLARCKAYGDLLLKVQLPSGCISAWLKAEDHTPIQDPLCDAGAESAESAAFLAELHGATKDERYAVGAMSALQFLRREVLPTGRWVDRVVCDMPRDVLSGQYPRSAASMVAAARACAVIYHQTGRTEYLALGEQIMGEISLLQNAWECRWSDEPFGGMASQNFGSALSPRLQANAADTFVEFSFLTGKTTYLDRGLAALRAAFATIDGSPGKTRRDAFDPAAADVLTFAEMLCDFYGDAAVNVAEGWGRGINGCLLGDPDVREDSISFELVSPFGWKRPAVVKFWECPTEREVIVNGKSLGIFTPAQLWEGVKCSPMYPLTIVFMPTVHSLAGVGIELVAKVYGGAGKPEVRLFCRREGEADFVGVEMVAGNGSTYTAQIPGELSAQPGAVEYYIQASSGREISVAPMDVPAGSVYYLNLTAELTVRCGAEDAPYLDADRPPPPGRFTAEGRMVFTECSYVFPVPPDTQAIHLEIDRQGLCAVYVGEALLPPANDHGTGIYHIEDPALWRDQKLRVRIEAPDGAAALLRRIKLTPRRNDQIPISDD